MNIQEFNFDNVSEVETRYINKVKVCDGIKVEGSRLSQQCFFHHWNKGNIEYVESFKVMLLNRAHQILGIKEISTGGISGCLVDIKVIFQIALKCNASAIIVAHNHPSGNNNPSEQDLGITKKIKQAGEILDIKLLDHVILTSDVDRYYSMADNGYI